MQAINIPDRKSSIPTRLNLALERLLLQKYSIVVGADEAGRGPLAGPVVAAGVSLPSRMESDSSLTPLLNIIRDSKLLSENEREEEYAMMVKTPGLLYAVEIRDNRQIDEMNILQASLDAMGCAALRVADAAACAIVRRRSSGSPPQTTARRRRPGLGLKTKILFDGNAVPRAMRSSFEHVVDEAPSAEFRKPSSSTGGAAAILSIDAEAIVKGDAKVASIAAASIFAKVTRDRLMMELHRQYPLYGFSTHKGYPTAQHLAALKRHGPCSVHRASFQPLRRLIENGELSYPFEGKSAAPNSDNAISVPVASTATHEMRTRIHIQSPDQRQVTGHKPKTDAFSDSSPSTRSTQQSSESGFLGEFNKNIHVGTRAYMGSRGKETLKQMAFLNASSRPVNRRRTETSPVSQNRRIMTKVSMKSGSRASPKNTTGKSVSKPQSRTTRNKSRGATTPERLLMSGAKKETSTEVCDMPRKLSRKNKKEQTSRNRDTPARKLQLRRIRTGHHAEPLQKDIHTQPRSGTHTSRGSKNNVQKEEERIETARAKRDSVQSGYSRGNSTSPVRLRRRNAIVNAEEASKEARAAAARVRAAQQKSRGVESKQVLKLKGKQRRSPNKRSSARKRGVGHNRLQ